jgi:hypothetical protein
MSARLIILLSLLAAPSAQAYKGDGKLIDHGPQAAHNRFELDLGPVDLERSGRSEYRFTDLPDKEFTFGLKITAPRGGKLSHLPRATVRMTLLNEREDVLFEVSDELANWFRSETVSEWFLYLHGASQGQGTNLPARPSARYRLIFETVKADSSTSKFVVRLLGVGGGWK